LNSGDFYGPQRQENCPDAGDEIPETPKAVARGENTGGKRPSPKPQGLQISDNSGGEFQRCFEGRILLMFAWRMDLQPNVFYRISGLPLVGLGSLTLKGQ
jgi:hypothetical protein